MFSSSIGRSGRSIDQVLAEGEAELLGVEGRRYGPYLVLLQVVTSKMKMLLLATTALDAMNQRKTRQQSRLLAAASSIRFRRECAHRGRVVVLAIVLVHE